MDDTFIRMAKYRRFCGAGDERSAFNGQHIEQLYPYFNNLK